MSIRWGRQDKQRTFTTPIFISCPHDLIGHATCSLTICSHFTERDRRRKDPVFRALGGLYEGYLDDTFGKCFCPLLINRIAFGSPHSGSHEFDVGQRPAKSLGSWTPFRLQKIGLRGGSSHSSFLFLLLGSLSRYSGKAFNARQPNTLDSSQNA